MNGVQRFLSGHKNYVRGATFSGPVKSIADAVIKKPVARSGNSAATLAGTYTGTEPKTFEVEIVDATPTTPLVSAPSFVGEGTGTMTGITTGATTARTIIAELAELGELLTAAGTEIQGVRVIAKTPGATANAYRFRVTRTGLIFTPQGISLLTGLSAGTQSATGPEFDWDTKIMLGDGQVPADAHRVSFGEDRNNIYVQYKKYIDGKYAYFFEPAIKEEVPVGTVVNFVTGSYTVELRDAGSVLETYNSIVTLYDLLNAIKTTSSRLLVEGPVTYDRAPGGQALAELTVRTDAHAESNTGFTEVVIAPDSPTELIVAECYAATPSDDERAGIGSELWAVRGSVSGLIKDSVRTGDLIEAPYFSAKIKARLPTAFGVAAKGRIAVGSISHASRDDEEVTPELCPAALTLGINAQEQTLTFTYTARPATEECPCGSMSAPDLTDAECLGGSLTPTDEGGSVPTYTDSDTRDRLKILYDFFADTVRNNSAYLLLTSSSTPEQDPFVSGPIHTLYSAIGQTLADIVKSFEKTLAYIDPLDAGAVKTAGYDAWDTALTELQDDVADFMGGSGTPTNSESLVAHEAVADGDAVMVFEPSPGTYKIRKAAAGGLRYGFTKAAISAGATGDIHYVGLNDSISSTESGASGYPVKWWPSIANPGKWVKQTSVGTSGDPAFLINFSMDYVSATEGIRNVDDSSNDIVGYALLKDRYLSRLKWVLTEAELSPLGKFDADSLEAGDDCWRDLGTPYYWQVSGASGAYAPAFTGEIYYSARKGSDGEVRGTKEFGLQINVACPENLKVGDSFTVIISNIPVWDRYAKGDKVTLGVLGATDLFLFGGLDGDNVQTWFVSDSVAGALPPYARDLDALVAYDSLTGIQFLINEGSIPFAKGDKFTFSIEGGHFRWRSILAGVAGAWSASTAITLAPISLSDGLSLSFTLGESPAFFPLDVYRFQALQPYALSNLIVPDFQGWNWGTANPAVGIVDLGAIKTDIDALALSFHTLPSTATVAVAGSDDNVTYGWSEAITWRKSVMGKLLATVRQARYLKITVTGAPQGSIGGFFAGPAIAFNYSADVSINRQYSMLRGSGANPASRYQGVGNGGSISWKEGALTDADYPVMVAMIDWLKQQQDEPLIVFPQSTRQDELLIGMVESDSITFNDVFNFQPNSGHERRLSVSLPLRGVAFA